MNSFQYIVLTVLVVLCLWTVRGTISGQMRKRIAFFWMLVWGSAGFVLVWPESTLRVAQALGIGRGVDLVVYFGLLTTLVGFFYVYTRFRRLDRQLSLLVRRLAIDNPRTPVTKEPG